MKIDLPLENWVDVFGFVPRLQLVQLVPHIQRKPKRQRYKCRPTIGDRKFVSFIQFYLHKCGEITLGRLEVLNSPRKDHDLSIVKAYKNHPIGGRELPLADIPISQNIKNFEEIHLRYFDESVLRFLQEFQHHSLFTNVNLYFSKQVGGRRVQSTDDLMGIMANLMPLLTGIDSIVINSSASRDILYLFQNNEYSAMAKRMLELTKCLYIGNGLNSASDWCLPSLASLPIKAKSSLTLFRNGFDWYLQWLYTPIKNGMPRYLNLCDYCGDRTCPLFVECVKKDFLEAKETAVSFFVHLCFRDTTDVQSAIMDNGKTREKLVITHETFGMSISRHPIGINEKWIKEMNKDLMLKNLNVRERKIIIYI